MKLPKFPNTDFPVFLYFLLLSIACYGYAYIFRGYVLTLSDIGKTLLAISSFVIARRWFYSALYASLVEETEGKIPTEELYKLKKKASESNILAAMYSAAVAFASFLFFMCELIEPIT